MLCSPAAALAHCSTSVARSPSLKHSRYCNDPTCCCSIAIQEAIEKQSSDRDRARGCSRMRRSPACVLELELSRTIEIELDRELVRVIDGMRLRMRAVAVYESAVAIVNVEFEQTRSLGYLCFVALVGLAAAKATDVAMATYDAGAVRVLCRAVSCALAGPTAAELVAGLCVGADPEGAAATCAELSSCLCFTLEPFAHRVELLLCA